MDVTRQDDLVRSTPLENEPGELVKEVLESLAERDLEKEPLAAKEAVLLLRSRGAELTRLVAVADGVRRDTLGNEIRLCGIVNAKSGACSEDCAFCAQSKNSEAEIDVYGLLDAESIVAAAKRAEEAGAREFSIVTSGRSIRTQREVDVICEAVSTIRSETKMETCASLGSLDESVLVRLKEAGLQRFHHNLESAPAYFGEICTTHSFEERVETAKRVKKLGLKLCSGGIFGLGESLEQRVDMLMVLKDLGPDSVPLNFLNPIPGTALGRRQAMEPMEAIALIAVSRLVLYDRHIILCGGRENTLGSLQPLGLLAGATGLLVGDYLTTKGRPPEDDLRMIEDMGFEPVRFDT